MPKMSPADFIALLVPQAIEARRDGSPLFPSVRLAQNILETGFNLNEHNNLGGFKAGTGQPNEWWHGETYTTPTWEVVNGQRIQTTATWRSYDTVYDFYRDQDRLLQNSRYAGVRAAPTAYAQTSALYNSGYATDPLYATKLNSIINSYGLLQYDKTEGDSMTAEELKAFDALRSEVTALKAQLEASTKLIPAPAWFVSEFGSGNPGGVMNSPQLTAEGWRILAVGLRVKKQANG